MENTESSSLSELETAKREFKNIIKNKDYDVKGFDFFSIFANLFSTGHTTNYLSKLLLEYINNAPENFPLSGRLSPIM